MVKGFDYRRAPGHLIRRAHQVAVAVFMEETADFDVTPVQFAILNVLHDQPGEDQITVARKVAFDAATFGAVVARLEAKGWLRREPDAADRRRKLLWITPAGAEAVAAIRRAARRAHRRLLAPLPEGDREALLDLLGRLVAGHEVGERP